jgi:hypothetical protein
MKYTLLYLGRYLGTLGTPGGDPRRQEAGGRREDGPPVLAYTLRTYLGKFGAVSVAW